MPRGDTAVPGGNGIRFADVSFSLFGEGCGIALDGAAYCWGGTGGALGSPQSTGEIATLPLKLYGSP